MKSFIQKNPVITYYAIAFGWTWLVVLTLVLTGQTKDMTSPSIFFVVGGIISNVAPSIAAFIVSHVSEGQEGVRKLKDGFKIKSSFKWYLLALLTVPVITALTALISNYSIRVYQLSIVVPAVVMGLVWPIFSGFGEEFGWRGYILPRMLQKHGPLKAGIILGFIWEIWHIPMHYLAYKDFGSFMIPAFLTIGFINLILQTVIMTFIYIKSKGSIKLMILYHYTITASSIIAGALFKTEASPAFTVYESIISVVLFEIWAGVLYLKNRKQMAGVKEYFLSNI